MEVSNNLFSSLMDCVKERHSEVNEEILKEQDSVETKASKLIQDLRDELQQLKTRNQELEELRNTDDHLHLLQVCLK